MIRTLRFALMCYVILVLAGCGSDDPRLGLVKGTVTLNGQPGADLQVSFEPTAGGLGSTGLTDASGSYELSYDGGRRRGAVVGSHRVLITSAAGGGEAGGDEAVAPINIPASYNTASTITKEVAAGENTVHLEITTK